MIVQKTNQAHGDAEAHQEVGGLSPPGARLGGTTDQTTGDQPAKGGDDHQNRPAGDREATCEVGVDHRDHPPLQQHQVGASDRLGDDAVDDQCLRVEAITCDHRTHAEHRPRDHAGPVAEGDRHRHEDQGTRFGDEHRGQTLKIGGGSCAENRTQTNLVRGCCEQDCG